MNEISRSTIFRNKIKQAKAKREEDEKQKVHIGAIGHIDHGKHSLTEAIEMTKKNIVKVIFQSPEEEKMFSEIAKKINFEKAENETIER